MRILIQFIGQGVGVSLLRKRFGSKHLSFKMFLFPIPVILSIFIWLFLLRSTGWFALYGSLIAVVGAIAFIVFSKYKREIEAEKSSFEKDV
jgi:hypothetical protein